MALRRTVDCGEPALRAAHGLIRQLDARPGLRISADTPVYVVPDIIVVQRNGELITQINPAAMPRLRLNQLYVHLLHLIAIAADLLGQPQEARWLLRNAEQRFVTIKRVADAVITRQRAFFAYCDIA